MPNRAPILVQTAIQTSTNDALASNEIIAPPETMQEEGSSQTPDEVKVEKGQYLVRVVFLSFILTTVCAPALSQRPDSYLPINKLCAESQIRKNLEDLNYRDRTAFASLAIGVCKEQATTTLSNLLPVRDADVRSLAAYGLGLLGINGQKAIPVLVESLRNGNSSVRIRSAYALGQIGVSWPFDDSDERLTTVYQETVSAALKQALADKNPEVQVYAALALAYGQPKDKAGIAILINALKHKDGFVREAAAEALGLVGQSSQTVIPALISAIGDRDLNVRRAVIQSLGKVGKADSRAVIPILTAALGDSEIVVVYEAALALSEFGLEARPAVPALIAALRRTNEHDEMSSFVEALGTIGKDSVPLLIEALKDDNKKIRLVAIEALGLIGPDAKQAMPFLIALLDDRDDEARKSGIAALAKFEEAVPQLVLDLGSPDARRRGGAAAALGKIGPKAVPKLTESLRNTNPKIRAGIILAFMNMDPGSFPNGDARQRLLEALRDASNDSDEVVRYRAVLALRMLEPKTNNSLLIHKTSLTDEEEKVRFMAARMLIRTDPSLDQQTIPILLRGNGEYGLDDELMELFGELGKRAVPVLIEALKHPETAVRRNAAVVLQSIGKDAEASIPSLLDALKDEDDGVRGVVAETLMAISPNKADLVPALVSAVTSGNETNNRLSSNLQLIGRIAIPELITAFEKSDNRTRVKIAHALGQINHGDDSDRGLLDERQREIKENVKIPGFEDKAKSAVPNLCQGLTDKDPEVRSAAITALESISVETNTVIPCLINALGDNDEAVRRHAALALQGIAKQGVPELSTALQDKNAYTRKGAAFALGNVKPLPSESVSSLKKIVDAETEDLDIRRVAASSLEEAGFDMQPFFTKYELVSPQNAVCPNIREGRYKFYKYRFSIYSGRCEYTGTRSLHSGGGALFAAIKRFFSGKK